MAAVKPEMLGRRPHSMSDRDAASRDTVYQPKQQQNAQPRSRPSGGGGSKPARGGSRGGGSKNPHLPMKAPIPTPNPNAMGNPAAVLAGSSGAFTGAAQPAGGPVGSSGPFTMADNVQSTFPMRPEAPHMPGMPAALPGLPIELQDQTPMPNAALAGPPPMAGPPMSPPQVGYNPAAALAGASGPYTGAAQPPGGMVGSTGRGTLASMMKPPAGGSPADALKMDLNYKTPAYHLPWWLGGTG